MCTSVLFGMASGIVDRVGSEVALTLRASAVEIAAAIRAGRVTSRAVVEAHIARIERVNPTINAVVGRATTRRAPRPTPPTRACREPPRRRELPPLLGVPCTIKECFALAGMPNCRGAGGARGSSRAETTRRRSRAAARRGRDPARRDQHVRAVHVDRVQQPRLRAHATTPTTRARIVGGSSGGEGAIVGAGGSPFGLGSDVGGSIRMPAFFNGVFGHKPTRRPGAEHRRSTRSPQRRGDADPRHRPAGAARRGPDAAAADPGRARRRSIPVAREMRAGRPGGGLARGAARAGQRRTACSRPLGARAAARRASRRPGALAAAGARRARVVALDAAGVEPYLARSPTTSSDCASCSSARAPSR